MWAEPRGGLVASKGDTQKQDLRAQCAETPCLLQAPRQSLEAGFGVVVGAMLVRSVGLGCSSENLVDHTAVDVGEPAFDAIVVEAQAFVV